MIYWPKEGRAIQCLTINDQRIADKSQAEIACFLGISQQHYSQYERGERELPMRLMAGRTNNKGGRSVKK